MSCKARVVFLSHGKHNNLHINVKVGGTRKYPIFIIKVVVFFDNQTGYITHTNLREDFKDLLSFDSLTEIIRSELHEYDYDFTIQDNDDYFVKDLKTVDILNKFNL